MNYGEITEHLTRELILPQQPTVRTGLIYRPVPHTVQDIREIGAPVWRVRFVLATDPSVQFGLAINGEVVLGRDSGKNTEPGLVNLRSYGAGSRGVSRQHALLRPTATNLYLIDLGSTNGTWHNGRAIGVKTPYALADGDMISLGRLRLLVYIAGRPAPQPPERAAELDLTDALQSVARAITSQLNLDDVLYHAAQTARTLTEAGETSIWLVDEASGDLRLEAEWGADDDTIRRISESIGAGSTVAEVMRTGKLLSVQRMPGEEGHKVKTGYYVEAAVYVPISLGGDPFGVLLAVHREEEQRFSARDEQLLAAIADFTAIAAQNARAYRLTNLALERRVKELSALNELASTVSSSLDLERVYDVLCEQLDHYWPVSSVRLYVLDEDGRGYYLLSEQGRAETVHPFSSGLVGMVARRGTVYYGENPEQEAAYDPAVDGLEGAAPKTLICIPLYAQAQVVGVLALYDKKDGPFTLDDSMRLRAFANPIAAAVANARLFAESERQRRAVVATAEAVPHPLNITLHALSHDMRGPLTSIVGYTHILERTLPRAGRFHEHVRQIKDAADRMLGMVSQLLEGFDGTSVNEREITSFSTSDAVNQIMSDLSGAAAAKEIELTCAEEGVPVPIIGDETRIYHTLMNVVANAVKFSPPRTLVSVILTYSEKAVKVDVRDEGPGILPHDLPFIFDKYYRGKQTSHLPGSGFGLYFARNTVLDHGGTITASNRPEGGAHFSLLLPTAPELPPQTAVLSPNFKAAQKREK